MPFRPFDLNIEEVLENWEVEHALRELIANAIDEQVLSETEGIEIFRDERGDCRIRDCGRGLRIEHFTLNENKEKLESLRPVIGKFGVGLKDALATLHRRDVKVLIRSRHGTFKLFESSKRGFDSITTLHVAYDDTTTPYNGTELILRGVTEEQLAKAKSLFMRFGTEQVIDTTPYGQVVARRSETARVYIMGVLASEEPNFLFSYNVTSLTDAMKKRLNRERLNVGRTTYTERVKSILKSATSRRVHDELVNQVPRRALGDQRDEMNWIEISQLAINLMNDTHNVAYVTEEELVSSVDLIAQARSDGIQVIVISEQQKAKVLGQVTDGGPRVRTLDVYAREFNESFQYEFVNVTSLNDDERKVFDLTPRIFGLVGLTPHRAPQVHVSETMRITSADTDGVWDSQLQSIIIHRPCLESVERYSAVLLHEAAHATSNPPDATREFEHALTEFLGLLTSVVLSN